MVSLILLSMVLSASSAAAQTVQVPVEPILTQTHPAIPVQPETSQTSADESGEFFDHIAIQPDSVNCYKIRAYIFSNDPVPKLLRETTCGPMRPTSKNIGGAKPKLVPIDAKDKSVQVPER
jgi:hypothetical protein